MRCNQCEMLSINGVPCHEIGCPNSNAEWDETREEWVHYTTCFECGCDVECDKLGRYWCDCRASDDDYTDYIEYNDYDDDDTEEEN